MDSSLPSSSRGVTLTCPDCGTPVTATIDFRGRSISCPACLATIVVPDLPDDPIPLSASDQPPVSVPGPAGSQPPAIEQPLDESYRLAFFGSDKSSTPPEKVPASDDVDEPPETFSLAPTTGRSQAAEDSISYTLGKQTERLPEKIEVFKALSHVKREKRPPPPKSLFFSNVFQFPWSSGTAIVNWSYLSFGLTFMGLLFAASVWLLETMGRTGWLGMGFLLMAVVWAGLWSLSFASAISVAVVTETAAGMDRVESWGEGGWRDWLFEFALLLWVYIFSGFVCMPFALGLKEIFGVLSPQLFVMQFFAFPALWLSAMDSESVLIPFSTIVFGSFRRIPGTWAKFYGLALALLVPAVSVIAIASYFSPWIGGFLSGPILASVIFIYARLLGRLGYAVITEMERPLNPASKKPTSTSQKPKSATNNPNSTQTGKKIK